MSRDLFLFLHMNAYKSDQKSKPKKGRLLEIQEELTTKKKTMFKIH